MQAQPKYLGVIISALVISGILGALIGTALLICAAHLVRAADSVQIFRAHNVEVMPVREKLAAFEDIRPGLRTGQVRFACQSNDNPRPTLCYGPDQIRHAYGVDKLLEQHITGQGSTIAIIDAYGSPTLQRDLRAFDGLWNITRPALHIIEPYGHPKTDESWVAETSLDVEWAHAMAPDATINLVVAKSSNDVDLYYTIKYAVEHDLGDVLSFSFGENEHCIDARLRIAEHKVLSEAVQKGVTIVVAAGDSGSAQPTCDDKSYIKGISFPASDPLVTAVGGTALRADAVSGEYKSESAWNEAGPYDKAGGGGYSSIYARPGYQARITGKISGRAVPDLSLNASVDGGVLIYQSDLSTGELMRTIMGGTSVGTPELAGLIADGVQMAHHRLGQINPALYRLGRSANYHTLMNDITSGDNALVRAGIPGYTAGRGWDAATGWGSPKQAYAFFQALILPNQDKKRPASPQGRR